MQDASEEDYQDASEEDYQYRLLHGSRGKDLRDPFRS